MRTKLGVALNALQAVCLFYGLVHEVQGALYIGMFMVWWCVGAAFVTIPDSVWPIIREQFDEQGVGSEIVHQVDVAYDFGIVAILVWHGWFVTGAFYAIHTVLLAGARRKYLKELRLGAKTEATDSQPQS